VTNPGVGPEFGAEQGGVEDEDSTPPVVRDKRRVDPETGELRDTEGAAGSEADAGVSPEPADNAEADGAEALAAERLADLQRLQAEFTNYRRRVDRDRDVARQTAVADMCESLIPVLDAIELARQHGELDEGPFKGMAENLEAILSKYEWERYGAEGEEFDPVVHEALMHESDDDAEVTTIKQVLQPGYRVGEKILRAARVAVVGP